MSNTLCPKGHLSSEPDYCSECGARMEHSTAIPPAAPTQPDLCPACGARREPADALFCEICGYNFVTGMDSPAPPPMPTAPRPDPVPPPPPVLASATVPATTPAAPRKWTATVSLAPAAHGAGSPAPPPDVAATSIALAPGSSLIGRRSTARAIFPEIDLSFDTAVSHRHALLELNPAGELTLRDIGSSNGTLRNGQPVTPLQDVPLSPGDVLELGHWTRILVEASA